jgi:DNA repair exonuclease SbcCD nuclease subunit
MSVTFIHTADWQLGKPFATVEDDARRARLQEERFRTLERIGQLARESGAAFVLVAGDLFDSPTPTKAVVSRACSLIGAMKLPVLVIPGNHDYGGPGSLWEQPYFLSEQSALAPNLTVLRTAEPLELDGAVLLPCPLLRRHESSDPTAWVRGYFDSGADPGAKPRIVLAHGSVQEFTSIGDDDADSGYPNLIDLARLEALPVDYVALGDWHGRKSVGARTWYSGTHEADRFPRGEGHEQGFVLKVTIQRGSSPAVESIRIGAMAWFDESVSLTGDDVVARLDARLAEIAGSSPDRTLVRLILSGSLGFEADARLRERLDAWRARLLDLRLDDRTSIEPSPEEIEALSRRPGDPLISRVAGELLNRVSLAGDEGPVACEALRLLYATCHDRGGR